MATRSSNIMLYSSSVCGCSGSSGNSSSSGGSDSSGSSGSSWPTLEQRYEQDRVLKYTLEPGNKKTMKKINDNLQSTWVMSAMSYILPKGFPFSVGSNYERYITFQAVDGTRPFVVDVC